MGADGVIAMIYTLNDQYYVRPLRLSDLEGDYPLWFEDQEVCQFNSHGKFFKTIDYFRQYIETINLENKVVWAICHQADGHIGNISLQEISMINRNAEFAIIIGNKKHWGQGIGKLAGLKLIQHGLYKLNLERIYCSTADTNQAMKALAISLGMIQEGCRRKHLFIDGEWVDLVEYGLLREDAKGEKIVY
ncbi:GCN5-ike N-acetyltransferase [Planktothrix agardhii]|jgi:ribosomal-protein-alanine N-acetyltransferase|uniref:GNAT family N-acetyltransferase n=1 Tax=Planktothrix TaxID=54304 RepID=UPI00192AE39B|nr:GNAT family protein [Planktothrix agardhii]CAD5926507.1 GCN5-ike N-acetyltransferase [Planktothrix agardhii]